jgi:hypothetical protein
MIWDVKVWREWWELVRSHTWRYWWELARVPLALGLFVLAVGALVGWVLIDPRFAGVLPENAGVWAGVLLIGVCALVAWRMPDPPDRSQGP